MAEAIQTTYRVESFEDADLLGEQGFLVFEGVRIVMPRAVFFEMARRATVQTEAERLRQTYGVSHDEAVSVAAGESVLETTPAENIASMQLARDILTAMPKQRAEA